MCNGKVIEQGKVYCLPDKEAKFLILIKKAEAVIMEDAVSDPCKQMPTTLQPKMPAMPLQGKKRTGAA